METKSFYSDRAIDNDGLSISSSFLYSRSVCLYGLYYASSSMCSVYDVRVLGWKVNKAIVLE
jgi:hypothetical protein